MTTQPLWLSSAGVRELLDVLVDRLDASEQRGTATQSVALNERNWPALYKANFESRKEELWEHVGEMCRWGWLQAKPKGADRSPSGYAYAPRLSVLNEAAVRGVVNRPERVKSSAMRWREAVQCRLVASDAVKAAVSEFCIDIPDRPMDEVVSQLNGLPGLAGQPLLLREVSAQLFWGMSKVLDKRQALVAAVLGVDDCPFPESPLQLQVQLPKTEFSAILFIENQMSFERAARAASQGSMHGLALVYASGFKGSAQRLRSRRTCSVYYSSSGALDESSVSHFQAWLFEHAPASTPTFFWGDLDYSGMCILSAMRTTFPDMAAWRPGYQPMLESLLAGAGHSPEAAEKQGQRPVQATGCSYADADLLPALQRYGTFVDQEGFHSWP